MLTKTDWKDLIKTEKMKWGMLSLEFRVLVLTEMAIAD